MSPGKCTAGREREMRSRANKQEQHYLLNCACLQRVLGLLQNKQTNKKPSSVQKTSISKMCGCRALEPTETPRLPACPAALTAHTSRAPSWKQRGMLLPGTRRLESSQGACSGSGILFVIYCKTEDILLGATASAPA